METFKLHWNSVISTPNVKYCTGNISDMYLMSNLVNSEYVKFKVDMIPPRIIAHYKLEHLIHEGCIYAKINKAWYGLKQAGRIAHDNLVQHLKKHGFVQAKKTDGLFTHVLRDISFTLVVDDFGIQYTNKQDCDYLIRIMTEKYKFQVDYDTKQYIRIHLQWDYYKREVVCSMEGYVAKALEELEHIFPKKHYYGPSNTRPPTY